jgi:hypothetical protein
MVNVSDLNSAEILILSYLNILKGITLAISNYPWNWFRDIHVSPSYPSFYVLFIVAAAFFKLIDFVNK